MVRSTSVRLAVLVAATSAASPDAFAQLAGGGLSDAGLIGSGSSLRDTASALLAGQPTVNTGLPFTFSGSIDVEAGVTDGVGGSGIGIGPLNGTGSLNGSGSDSGIQPFILIAPDFNFSGVTSRLSINLNYSPRLAYYPSSGSQTLFANTFNGTATATIVPNWLYFSVRGLTGISSRFGDASLQSNSFLTQNEAVQTSSFSVSPYLLHTFGGVGTLNVGYSYSRTFQDGDNRFTSLYNAPNAANTAGFGTIGNLATSSEYATFTTGEDFGRVQNTVSVIATQNGGDSFYGGSTTLSATDTLGYSLYRWLTLLGTVGYQEYNYPSAGYRLNEPTYLFGFTVIPNADSSITVQYGQTAGSSTVVASGTYAPTARTRIYGSYNVGIQTGLGARQGLLSSTTVGPGGILLDRVTGSPVLSNNYLASQSTLSRVKALTIGGILLLDRDTFSLSIGNTQSTQLINSTSVFGVSTPAGTSVDSTFASLGWQHDLNPSNSLNTLVSYVHSNNGVYYGTNGGTQDTVQFSSSLNHIFTDTLSGSVTYSHAERFGSAVTNVPATFGGSASQNVFLVGLRKSF